MAGWIETETQNVECPIELICCSSQLKIHCLKTRGNTIMKFHPTLIFVALKTSAFSDPFDINMWRGKPFLNDCTHEKMSLGHLI